jgi:stage V sporulation protein B
MKGWYSLLRSKQTFVQGAFILLIGNIVGKIAGALFKIPLGNILGAEGMAYYNYAYTIYTWVFVIATAGLPVAVSRMVSEARTLERPREVRKIVHVTLALFCIVGVAGMLILIVGARAFSSQMPEAIYGVYSVAPAILFVIIMSTFRGYFQGNQNMIPTSVSQMIESVGKLIVGIILAVYLLQAGYALEIVSAGAIGGVSGGALLGAIFIALHFMRNRKKDYESIPDSGKCASRKAILKKLVRTAVPISLGSSIISVTNFIDMFLVIDRLQAGGATYQMAKTLYGSYTGYAITLFNLPPTLVSTLGISALPIITSYITAGRNKSARRTMESALRLCVIVVLPCAFGFLSFAEPILKLLYPSAVAANAVEVAAPLLRTLGFATFFVSMSSLTTTLLQATGHMMIPIRSMLIGGAVKLITNYILIGIPAVGINGAPIGTNLCYLSILILNLIALANKGHKLRMRRILLKPLLASLFSVGVTLLLFNMVISPLIGIRIGAVAAILIVAVLYAVALLFLRAFSREDIQIFSKNGKVERFLDRYHLLEPFDKNQKKNGGV